MVNRRRCVALVCILAIGGALLAGCGSSSTTATTPTDSAAGAGPSNTGPATSAAPMPPNTRSGSTVRTRAAAGEIEINVVSTPYGSALGSGDGRVLYAWDKEASGAAVCVDAACVEKWPPLVAAKITTATGIDATAFTLVDRPDGTKQVALNGRRLYNMMLDAPGEANCQGAEGWWILKPDGSKNTSQTPA